VDVLVAATYSDDGSLGTACSSLAMRLRELNGVVGLSSLSIGLCLLLGRLQSPFDFASNDPVRFYRPTTGAPGEVAVTKVAELGRSELRGSVPLPVSIEAELINRIPPSD